MQREAGKYTLAMEKKAIKTCNKCGCDVAWDVNRNGKSYLRDVAWSDGRPRMVGLYHVCRGTVDNQVAQVEKDLAQLNAELAAVNPDDWFNNTDTIKTAIAATEAKLAELKSRQSDGLTDECKQLLDAQRDLSPEHVDQHLINYCAELAAGV